MQPNSSNRLRPEFLGGPLITDEFFKNRNGVKSGGLVYLDLLRGAESKVRSVRSLAAQIHEDDQRRSKLLPDPDSPRTAPPPWVEPLTAWLKASTPISAEMSKADIDNIAKDPPLYLFTLFEAAIEQGGERLGILGSTVVAEVVADSLRRNWRFIEGDRQIEEAAMTFFGGDIPETMPALIRKLNEAGRQNQTSCDPLIS